MPIAPEKLKNIFKTTEGLYAKHPEVMQPVKEVIIKANDAKIFDHLNSDRQAEVVTQIITNFSKEAMEAMDYFKGRGAESVGEDTKQEQIRLALKDIGRIMARNDTNAAAIKSWAESRTSREFVAFKANVDNVCPSKAFIMT